MATASFDKFVSLAIVCIALNCLCPSVEAFFGFSRLTLYEDENQEGNSFFVRVGRQCMMLPDGIQEWASSVETHDTCTLLCRLPHCRSCVQMFPGSAGHYDLRAVELNDQVVSVRACDLTN